jgi:hypothetical protein
MPEMCYGLIITLPFTYCKFHMLERVFQVSYFFFTTVLLVLQEYLFYLFYKDWNMTLNRNYKSVWWKDVIRSHGLGLFPLNDIAFLIQNDIKLNIFVGNHFIEVHIKYFTHCCRVQKHSKPIFNDIWIIVIKILKQQYQKENLQ